MNEQDTVSIISAHCDRRLNGILRAYRALSEVSREDRKLICKWLANGGINELELGRLIADYRESLGNMCRKPKLRRIVRDLV